MYRSDRGKKNHLSVAGADPPQTLLALFSGSVRSLHIQPTNCETKQANNLTVVHELIQSKLLSGKQTSLFSAPYFLMWQNI